jgi:riboflavin kinase/FMN adenylyltransferase
VGIEQELARLVPQGETLLTIGVFDGVHAGHHYLLNRLKERAREEGLLGGVVTFDPHPQWVLHRDQLPWLSTLEERVYRLRQREIDFVAVISFTPEVAKLHARQFVYLLKKYLKMRVLMIGPDFALGRGRAGDSTLLSALGKELGFTVETVPPFTIDGEVVSSTLIRQSLAQGDMAKVTKLMGHPFDLLGEVVPGEKRGQLLGFPTANLHMQPQQALPGNGVYATIAQVDGKRFPSATSIGTRPTFGNGARTVEVHLLDYQGDLYGKQIKTEFVWKLRNEQCFASSEQLKSQMKEDIENVRIFLAKEVE